MKKILMYVMFCHLLHAMDHVAPEVKIAWSYPVVRVETTLIKDPQEFIFVRYKCVKCDDTGKYFECDTDVNVAGRIDCCTYTVKIGNSKREVKDGSCLRILENCKKSEQGLSSCWSLKIKQYETFQLIPLDRCARDFHYCPFKAYQLSYDPEQCLAVALIDRWQHETGTIDKLWCLYTVFAVEDKDITHGRPLELRYLRKLFKCDVEVLHVGILPGGRCIAFFLQDGTIRFVSPDVEKTLYANKNKRLEKLVDLFFRWV